MAIRRPGRRGSLTREYKSSSPFMELARTRYTTACEFDEGQDRREIEDLKFYNDDQWPEDVKRLRAGRNAEGGLPPVPARPCLTINKVKAPVLRVMNQERQSDLGIEIVPADDFESLTGPIADKEIELREGLVRRIQRQSEAADARSWAFQRGAIAGRGYYRVLTRYMPGKTMQQEVVVARIFNQGAVKLDPTHEQPDGSDADWGFIGSWMPWERYLANYPKVENENGQKINNPFKTYDNDSDFTSLTQQYPQWFRAERGPTGEILKAVYVTEYIYCEYENRTLLEFADGHTAWDDETDEDIASAATDSRSIPERKFTHCVIDGVHILEQTEWPIPYTGIIKVLGEEVQPYDNERRVIGIVRPSRDSQQGFNAMVSKMVEVVALAPIPAIMLAEGQDEGFQHEYAAAMTRTLPVLHYKQTDSAGAQAPPPFSPPRNSPIEPVGFALQMFAEAIQDTTATHDSALGKSEKNVTSAKHAKLLTDETGMSTSGLLDNLTRSVRYEGLLINELLWHVYGRKPGRLAHLVTGEGEAKSVLIGQPFTMDPAARRPVPVPPPMPGMPMGIPPGMPPPGPPGMNGRPNGLPNGLPSGMPPMSRANGAPAPQIQEYTLTEHARFNVAVKVTRTYDTRREQEHQSVGQVIAADPNLMQVIGDLFFKSMDGPGHKEMAERMQLMLAPPVQEYLKAKKEGRDPVPPQVQQQMDQAKKMIEALSKQLEAVTKKLQTDEIKQSAENARTQFDGQVALQTEAVRAQAEVAKAQVQAQLQIELQKLKMAQANLDREDTQAHEMAMGSADAAAAADQAQIQAERVAAQTAQQAGHEREAQFSDQQAAQASQTQAEQAQAEQAAQAQAAQAEQAAQQQAADQAAAAQAPEPEA
jgi:hypothetical protein